MTMNSYISPNVSYINNGAMADMLISKNDKSWVVEIKADDRDSFIKTFVSLELWKEYQKEYKF